MLKKLISTDCITSKRAQILVVLIYQKRSLEGTIREISSSEIIFKEAPEKKMT